MTTATKTQTSHKKRKIPPKVIRKTWTSAEVSELGELYGTITTTELATRYGVSPQQVREKASALGLANQRVKARNRAAQQAAALRGYASKRVTAQRSRPLKRRRNANNAPRTASRGSPNISSSE